MNIEKEVATMQRSTVDELRVKYSEVFGEATNGRNKQWLIKRITWRMQANAEGGLSERARKRAMELANDADIRMTAPRQKKLTVETKGRTTTVATKMRHAGDLPPGATLRRIYKGETILVRVLDEGFQYEGERYKSLTAIAKAVTGQHWNGRQFFGLRKTGAK